jgi:hypothetical protein
MLGKFYDGSGRNVRQKSKSSNIYVALPSTFYILLYVYPEIHKLLAYVLSAAGFSDSLVHLCSEHNLSHLQWK